MKRKLFFVLAAIMIFGIVFAAYAYNNSITAERAAAKSCCKGDSCPMKMKKSEVSAIDEKKSCCDCDCCKDGCCSAKAQKDGASHAVGHEMKEGESCPVMKAGHKNESGIKHEAEAAKHECSCGCACCGGEKKDAETSAV